MKLEELTNLFTDSASSGKLINFSITDFGEKIQKAKISFGQVPLGIYRKGPKKRRKPIFHDEEKEKELHQLAANLTQKSRFYASLRNFQQKIFMNFTQEDFNQGLYFSTFTFNNYQKKMPFSFAPWRKKRKCPVPDCNGKHFYRQVSHLISSFLAEKKIAKKRMGRNLEGANDLFNQAIHDIQKKWGPSGFKYVAVPELHKCQIPCHWKGKKHRKSSWKNHDESHCHCLTRHDCRRNWHIHMLSTNFLPSKYDHEVCGLGKYNNQGQPQVCWDHRAYIVHEIWPYGLVDIKQVSHLKISNKPIKSAEGVVIYLTKYLAKSFLMRTNVELAKKSGLLSGMKIYKFFQTAYGHYKGKSYDGREKIKKPKSHSYIFINNDYGCAKQFEKNFASYFADGSKLENSLSALNLRRKPKFIWRVKKNWPLVDILKMCLYFSNHNYIKKNHYWKPCDTSEDPIWKKGQGWKVLCPITKDRHIEPIIRWEFEFNDSDTYASFKNFIYPALQHLNLPNFQKFSDYRARAGDYEKFARQAELPWNKEINEYVPLEEAGESAKSPQWRENIPLELIYNFVYLKEIRAKISISDFSPALSGEKAMDRYADY